MAVLLDELTEGSSILTQDVPTKEEKYEKSASKAASIIFYLGLQCL